MADRKNIEDKIWLSGINVPKYFVLFLILLLPGIGFTQVKYSDYLVNSSDVSECTQVVINYHENIGDTLCFTSKQIASLPQLLVRKDSCLLNGNIEPSNVKGNREFEVYTTQTIGEGKDVKVFNHSQMTSYEILKDSIVVTCEIYGAKDSKIITGAHLTDTTANFVTTFHSSTLPDPVNVCHTIRYAFVPWSLGGRRTVFINGKKARGGMSDIRCRKIDR
jgi:hypothetical protein